MGFFISMLYFFYKQIKIHELETKLIENVVKFSNSLLMICGVIKDQFQNRCYLPSF